MQALRLWQEMPASRAIAGLQGGRRRAARSSPELLGVGYIIGPRIACVMVGGGVLADLVLAPAIAFFGENATEPVVPGTVPIAKMSPKDIRDDYILYIGAGAVAAGGIISMFQALPLIVGVDRRGPPRPAARPAPKATATAAGPDGARPADLARRASARRRWSPSIAATHLIPTDLAGRHRRRGDDRRCSASCSSPSRRG